MSKQSNPRDDPPAYPQQVHFDAGPANSPYNAYGGFANSSNKPDQSHLDPRGPGGPDGFATPSNHGYASPAPPMGPGGYASPAPYGGYPPPQGYYGGPPPQQGMYYQQPPPQQAYYGGYPPQQQMYYQDRGYGGSRGAESACAGIFSALACCCCLDLLVF